MKTIVTVPQPVTKFPLLIFKNSCPQLETNRTMERFKKKTKWRLPIILVHVLLGGARNIRGFFFFFLSDYGEELRVMIMKPGMVWHKDQLLSKLSTTLNDVKKVKFT